jgi:hypothetical protein
VKTSSCRRFHWNVVAICNPGSIVRAQTAADLEELPKEERPIMIHMCSLSTQGRHLFHKLRSYVCPVPSLTSFPSRLLTRRHQHRYLQVAWNNEKVPQGEPAIKVNPETIKGYVPRVRPCVSLAPRTSACIGSSSGGLP